MALDLATFKAHRPEFSLADDPIVQAALDLALALCPASRWGSLQDQGVELRACVALALSPFARNMNLASKDGTTVYDGALQLLIMVVGAGGFVI